MFRISRKIKDHPPASHAATVAKIFLQSKAICGQLHTQTHIEHAAELCFDRRSQLVAQNRDSRWWSIGGPPRRQLPRSQVWGADERLRMHCVFARVGALRT